MLTQQQQQVLDNAAQQAVQQAAQTRADVLDVLLDRQDVADLYNSLNAGRLIADVHAFAACLDAALAKAGVDVRTHRYVQR
jgi:hypothetical protein